VLIGPNNEGKSNILRALNAAMSALSSRGRRIGVRARRVAGNEIGRARGYEWSRDFPISLTQSRSDRLTRITLEFSLLEFEIEEFKRNIKSNLNGTLPVCITFSKDDFDVKIIKQGPGSATLNSKSDQIAQFLADRIQFQYIPAVRTAQQSTRIVESIIAGELSALEEQSAYREATAVIKNLQKPVLDEFSRKTTDALKLFLPAMRSVTFSVSDEQRYSALRQSIDIEVDDGTITSLEAKGDGIQSLVALGLRRYLLEENREKRTYIFAIEEPEVHLHSDAIHKLRDVLHDLAKVDQLIITTHSGLLANRSPVSSNIIVHRSKASPAGSLADIRTALGIRSRDNLINAELVLLVEGDDDKLALRSILGSYSGVLEDAFNCGRIILESLGGAGSLSSKIGLYKSILCEVHCFLDNDDAGRTAIRKAIGDSLIEECDYNLALLHGRKETEFEDILNQRVYADKVNDRFGIDLANLKPRNRRAKWSARMSDVFSQAGKPFNDVTKQRIKFVVAEAVAASPAEAIADHAKGIITSLIEALIRKLKKP
jgi:predicted ATP-dependent endonuclease of OLD family